MLFRHVLDVVITPVCYSLKTLNSQLEPKQPHFSRNRLAALAFSLFAIPSAGYTSTHHAGATLGNFDVGQTGEARYSIPLQVPPGIAGMQPKLSLEYNSQSGNGLLGVGWSLGGLSSITRCPAAYEPDGFIDGVDFDSNDRFCLDGQRLVTIAPNEYRTEIDSYLKITSSGPAGNPDSFTAKTKSGQTLIYGTADSRIEANGPNTNKVMIWALKSIYDPSGNESKYSYVSDSVNGEYHIDRIDYAGNETTGFAASIRFTYEPRPDRSYGYIAGSAVNSVNRLLRITTYTAQQVVRDYRLEYETGTATKRSRIVKVSECSSDLQSAECKVASTFNWSDGQHTLEPAVGAHLYPSSFGVPTYYRKLTGDFDGDGLEDLAAVHTGPSGFTAFTSLAQEDGTFSRARGARLSSTSLGSGEDAHNYYDKMVIVRLHKIYSY